MNLSFIDKNKPVSDQIVSGGNLAAKSFQYRNTELTTAEYLGVLHYLIELCRNHFDSQDILLDPKTFFDNAIVGLRINPDV